MPGALWDLSAIRIELSAINSSAAYQKADFYRTFTTRLKEMFSEYKVLKGDETVRSVDVIYANPERAVAKIRETKNTTLPMLSLQFEGIEPAIKRRRPLEALVDSKFWDPQKQRAIRYIAEAPFAADLYFGVNVWGRYVEDINQLTEQLLLSFRPNLPIHLREGEVYQAFLEKVDETSTTVAKDREDRILKRRVRFKVEAYIPSHVVTFTRTGEIRSLNYDAYLQETSTLVPFESWKGPPSGGLPPGVPVTITESS